MTGRNDQIVFLLFLSILSLMQACFRPSAEPESPCLSAHEEFAYFNDLMLGATDHSNKETHVDLLMQSYSQINDPGEKNRLIEFLTNKSGDFLSSGDTLGFLSMVTFLKSLDDVAKNLELRARILLMESNYYITGFSGFKAIEILDSLIDDLKNSKHQDFLIRSYFQKGVAMRNQGRFEEAFDMFQRALAMEGPDLLSKELKIDILNNIATIHSLWANFDESLHYYTEALAVIGDKKENEPMAAYIYNNMAGIYYFWNKPEITISYLEKSVTLFKRLGLEKQKIEPYFNLGLSYQIIGDSEKALEYFNLCIEYCISMDMRGRLLSLYNQVASIHIENNRLDEAEALLRKSKDIIEHPNDLVVTDLYIYYYYYARLKIDQGEYLTAIEYLKLAEEITLSSGLVNHRIGVMKSFSEAHRAMENYEEAINYLVFFIELRDQLSSEQNNQLLAEYEARYQAQKKEREASLLRQEKEFQQIHLERVRNSKKWHLLLSLFASLGVLIVFIFIFRNKILLQKIQLKQTLDKHKRDRYKSVIIAQEKLKKKYSEELHDGLGQILGSASLHLSSLKVLMPRENEEAAGLLDQTINMVNVACSEIRSQAHNLAPVPLASQGAKAAIKDLVRNVFGKTLLKIQLDFDGIALDLPEEKYTALYRILQELMTNTLRHAQASNIRLAFTNTDSRLEVEYFDNGIGMDTEKLNSMHVTGWKNILTRAEMIGARLDVTSKNGQGLRVRLYF